ncbi:MAG: hypothetical protein E7165_03035 [Firmicutes bacterium]|nr:hypothetical protein [Bacillota bacterium]
MVNTRKYLLSKDNKTKELVVLDYNKLGGYEFNPKNSSNYIGVNVNKMVVIKPSFVEKVLKKKVKRKLDLYLQFIVGILDDEDTDPTNLRIVLNDIERYRRTIINKYQLYLDEKYVNLLLKKIDLLSHEIKMKLIYTRVPLEKQEENERRRGR